VETVAGVANLWVADAPEFRARPVTAFRDDGKAITSVAFAHGGRTVLFARDGASWAVPRAGAAPRRLPDLGTPAVSPRGDVVAYARGDALWVVSVDSGAAPRKLLDVARPGALRWSPDGTRLAFQSRRGDHQFVAVVRLADAALVWMSPGVDEDQDPAWSPDGRRLAFLREPVERRWRVFLPKTGAVPWSIRIADPATGESRELWRAAAGAGSVYADVEAPNDLLWSADDRLVFPWERSGWVHLYAVPAAGGPATPLTAGAFEVATMALSRDGREVLYTANVGDPDGRQVWRVPTASGAPRPVTRGPGLAWGAVELAGGSVAYTAASGRVPAHVAVQVPGGIPRPAGAALPASAADLWPVEPRSVTFRNAAGRPVHGQLFATPAAAGVRRPAVIFLHGGPANQTRRGPGTTYYTHQWYAMLQHLAAGGWVVLSVNYHGGTGYGRAYRALPNAGPAGASEYQDVVAGARYLRGRPDVDAAAVAAVGTSYGGLLTNLALARNSDTFAAGVSVHGVYDWRAVFEANHADYRPEAEPALTRAARAASPVADVARWRSPVLLVHGDADANAPFTESAHLAEDLRARGVPVEFVALPGEPHVFRTQASYRRAIRGAVGFLERRLGRPLASASAQLPGRGAPSANPRVEALGMQNPRATGSL
jgi:dipeptidyl aminopeptidase/acylaminoacyl peptidase